MNDGYKILIVEDNLAACIYTYWSIFYKWMPKELSHELSIDEAKSRAKKEAKKGSGHNTSYLDNANDPKEKYPDKDKRYLNALEELSFLDIAKNTTKALELVRDHSDKYLLFIIDRDLGKLDKVKIKEIWTDLDEKLLDKKDEKLLDKKKVMGGDLVIEYLCLEKGMIKESKARVYFLTANNDEKDNLVDFLHSMHFPKKRIDEMIIEKGDTEKNFYKLLRDNINDPAAFFIQHKHKDVFDALGKNAGEYSIVHHEHEQNLIKALAYVEDVKLNGEHLEKPKTELLRILLEAVRSAVKKQKNKFQISIRCIQDFDRGYQPQNGRVEHWFNPSSYSSANQVKIKKLPFDVREFQDGHSHYGDIDRMIHAITSQELHFKGRNKPEGKRLGLVVYGLCELLLFYHNKLKGEPIEVCEKDIHRTNVLNVMDMLDKTPDAEGYTWVSISDIKRCESYIGKPDLDEIYLDELGFEIDVCSRVKCESRN